MEKLEVFGTDRVVSIDTILILILILLILVLIHWLQETFIFRWPGRAKANFVLILKLALLLQSSQLILSE